MCIYQGLTLLRESNGQTARVWLVKRDLLAFPRVSGWRIRP